MDDFFSFISKTVIIIPVVVIILSLMFKFNQSKSGLINQTPTVIPIIPSIINKIPIDLIGPWFCHYQDGQKQYDLFIKNKNVVLQVKENNQSKKYDLSPYIPYAEGLLKTDIANIQSMVNQYSGRKIDVKKALDSCKKGE
ncbi:MAG: hypothetical protein AAB437_03745 [Patescibacteria group bacterium]